MDAYTIAAQIVTAYGEKYLPLFKRLHDEVELKQSQQHLKNIAATIALQTPQHYHL